MRKNSFTLLEAIFSITILVLTIGGSFALVQSMIGFTPITQQKLIASYLTQEGIEIVRNIRDTNWIEGAANWDDGIVLCARPCSENYQADYDDYQTLSAYTGNPLNLETATGLYGYGLGTATKFKRKITINAPVATSTFQVLVEVSWQEKGRTHSVKAMEKLYNWR